MSDANGIRNHFRSGGAAYAASRPTYPPALAAELADRCARTEHALDVGCGSGQLSTLLAERFERVTATDPSETQIESANPHPRVTYRTEPAERIGLPNESVDLLTAAQAAHWFDLDRFYAEVRRVVRPGGVLALVSYGVPIMYGAIGARLDRFYWNEIHPYWPDGRHHVEQGYRTLTFPFAEESLPELWITREWSRPDLIAYIRTWSAVKRALNAEGADVVRDFERDLAGLWRDPSRREAIRWPIAGRVSLNVADNL